MLMLILIQCFFECAVQRFAHACCANAVQRNAAHCFDVPCPSLANASDHTSAYLPMLVPTPTVTLMPKPTPMPMPMPMPMPCCVLFVFTSGLDLFRMFLCIFK